MTVTLSLSDAKDAATRRSLSDLSLSVAKSKKIVVVTGAGISCSCGIPVSFFVLLISYNASNIISGFSVIRRTLCSC